jgi:hypothetical protein
MNCDSHPQALAGWWCNDCQRALCPDCVVDDDLKRIRINRCLHCRSVVEILTLEKEIQPFWVMIPRFALAVLSARGLIHILIVSFVLVAMSRVVYFPILGLPLVILMYFGVFAGYVFQIIQCSAGGEESLAPLGSFLREADSMFGCAVRLFLSLLVVLIPLFFYVYYYGLGVFHKGISDSVLLGLSVFGVVYMPAAMILSAMGDSLVAMLNPLSVLGIIWRFPGQYFGLAVLLLGVLYLMFFLSGQLQLLMGPAYSFGGRWGRDWLGQSMFLAGSMFGALVLGRFIYQNAEAFGRTTGEALVPALPDAKPQAQMPPEWQHETVSVQKKVEPIEIDFDDEAQAPVVQGMLTPLAEKPKKTLLDLLCQALVKKDDQQALRAYEQLGRIPELPADLELALAQMLDRVEQPLAAAMACRRAAQSDLDGPQAAQALLYGARLLVEKAGRASDGEALLRFLIQRYPAHPFARHAREYLAKLNEQS